jgi:hypothetical protein
MVAVHNDQIGNDWNGLFANIRGSNGYLHDVAKIRIEASIGSFFESVASTGTIDLGICFAASHWLSRPVRIHTPGTLFFSDLAEPARGEIATMANRDWTDFLRLRASELKSGGWLIVATLSSVPDPGDPCGQRAAGRRLYRTFWRIAAELANEGRIDRALLEEFIFPVYFRLSSEVLTPLERETDLKHAFEIVELTNEVLPMPCEGELAQTGDFETYAASYAHFARAFAESTLRTQLFEGSAHSVNEADELANEFFRRLQHLFAAEPGRHAFEHQVMTLVLRRL